MTRIPPIRDLEISALALGRLAERPFPSWKDSEFAHLVRWRVTSNPETLLLRLRAAGLLERGPADWRLTNLGQQAFPLGGPPDWTIIARALIQTGDLSHDVELLLRLADVVGESVRVHQARARRVAPQLCALLEWDPAHLDAPNLVVPLALLAQGLLTVAAEARPHTPQWVIDQHPNGSSTNNTWAHAPRHIRFV